jgi:TonB family protein
MEAFSQIAESWWRIYSLHTLETSLFILLIFAIDRSVQLETKMRYALLILALAKCFVPPIFSAPEQVSQAIPAQIFLPAIESPGGATQQFSLSLPEIMFLLWSFSAVAIALIVLYQNIKLREKLKGANPISASEYGALFSNLSQEVRLYSSPKVETPLLIGFFRPGLYLPQSYTTWPQQQIRSVIAHEIAHLSGRDIWALSLQILALVLFGANPLIWFLHRKLLHVRELRCDEIAIRETGITPVEYSKLLYNFIETESRRRALVFSGAYFAQNKKTILGRFQHLLSLSEKGRSPRKIVHFALPILAGLSFIPFSWQCYTIPLTPEKNIDAALPPEQTESVFVAYDEAPEPIGGFAAIQKNLQYPEIARKAGIEGRVILNVLVAENGEIDEIKVLKSLGHNGCDEAAMVAVRAVKWKPAMQKGKPVKVWVGIPVIFKLNASGKTVSASTDSPGQQSQFVPYDRAPEPVGGFETIQQNLRLPTEAKGLKTRVIINVLVDGNGNVLDSKILKSSGAKAVDDAVMQAVQKTQWQPATQQNKPVRVWVAIPVIIKSE